MNEQLLLKAIFKLQAPLKLKYKTTLVISDDLKRELLKQVSSKEVPILQQFLDQNPNLNLKKLIPTDLFNRKFLRKKPSDSDSISMFQEYLLFSFFFLSSNKKNPPFKIFSQQDLAIFRFQEKFLQTILKDFQKWAEAEYEICLQVEPVEKIISRKYVLSRDDNFWDVYYGLPFTYFSFPKNPYPIKPYQDTWRDSSFLKIPKLSIEGERFRRSYAVIEKGGRRFKITRHTLFRYLHRSSLTTPTNENRERLSVVCRMVKQIKNSNLVFDKKRNTEVLIHGNNIFILKDSDKIVTYITLD